MLPSALLQDIVELHCACARASPWLWLTPYFGHRCAVVVDDFITAGAHYCAETTQAQRQSEWPDLPAALCFSVLRRAECAAVAAAHTCRGTLRW